MTTLYNDPARFRDDMVDGFVAAYPGYVERVEGTASVIRRGGVRPGKVSLVVGGGSGHYPAFCGLVGPGLADGAVVGDVFTSPSAEHAALVGRAVDGGAGILFSYGNYQGDVLHFGLAELELRGEGRDCRTVLVTDDVASAPPEEADRRRGIAGDFCVFKVAGAAAEQLRSLAEVERVARKANDATRTIGVAFGGCTLPGRDQPLFTVAPGTMELGLGIHGEPGVETVARLSAAGLAEDLVGRVLAERPEGASGRAAVILNGLGATKYEELFVLWGEVARRLGSAGVDPVAPEVGELVTSLDMAGCSLTLCWLDEELAELWEAPADTPAFRRGTAQAPRPTTTTQAARPAAAQAVAAATPAEASVASRQAAAVVRAALARVRDTIAAHEARLGDLDAVAGDGDHGRGMLRGARAAAQAPDGLGAGSLLRAAGSAWAAEAGGTSGALWGAMLQAAAGVIGDQDAPTPATVARAVRAAVEAVQRLGGARVGDKTLLDALVPFADELEAVVERGDGLAAAWRAAADAATAAADGTSPLRPRIGRARPLADRSVGSPDPGAISLALAATAAGDAGHGDGEGSR